MLQNLNQKQQRTNIYAVMETRNHSKNGASQKSHTSKRNKRSLIIFVYMLFFTTFSYAQETKLIVAVIDLSYVHDNSKYTANAITNRLTTELVNTKKFIVTERSRVEQMLKELGLQNAKNANVRAAEIGELLGVDKVITGKQAGGYARETTSIYLIDVKSENIEKTITIGNVVRNKKGKIVRQMSYKEIAKKSLAELLK